MRQTLASASVAQAPQPSNKHRVIPERLREVDRPHQELVVPGRGDPEPLSDPPFFGPTLLPPRSLEVQDPTAPLIELGGKVSG